MSEFEEILVQFKERIPHLFSVIVSDLEKLKINQYGCKSYAVNARNKLKELIELSLKLKKSSLEKSKGLPKKKYVIKGKKRIYTSDQLHSKKNSVTYEKIDSDDEL